MKKKKKGSHGAISVFLAIILVPCIVVSSVFVDLSRVHLSKTTAESSADLALNALLTNYDADLKDWYGMVASCQTIEQFYTVSAEYFLRALSSQGMTDDEIVLLSDYYAAATGDDTIYDLLQVECKSATEGMITEVAGANLSNAALLKDQIVEFMKYRAPIEITTGLIGRLSSDSTVMEALEADENEPLVEDKQEFYESEGALVEAAYHSYLAIKAYHMAADQDKLTNEAISGEYGRLAEYKNAYKEILRYAIANLSNTNGLPRYTRFTLTKTYYNDLYSNPTRNFSEVYSEKKNVDGTDTYYIDLTDVQKLVEDLQKKVDDFNTVKANFNSAAQPVLNKLPYGDGAGQVTPIQWWVLMNQAVNASNGTNHTKKIEAAAREMLRAYSRVLAIDSCELRGDIPTGWSALTDWKTQYGADSLIPSVESLQSTYLTAGVTNNNDTYLKAVKNLEAVSSSQYGNINAANLYVTVDGQSMNLNAALSHIGMMLSGTRQEIQNYVDLLDKAIDGDGADTPSLEELKTYVSTYEQKLDDWTKTAVDTDTNMGDADEIEIGEMQASIDIDEGDVDILKTRLVNIRSQLKAVIAAIDSMKWGGTALTDIRSIDAFKSASGIDTAQMGSTNGEIDSYTNTLFGQKFEPQTLPSMEHVNDSAYNPKINPISKEVDTPELWVYLYSKYAGSESGMDQAESEKEEANKAGTNKANETKDKNRYNGGGKDVPWAYSDNTSFDLSDTVMGVIGVVEDLVTMDFTGMRDDLYATTYVMEMFSYATFENEGMYHLLEESDPDKITQLTVGNYSAYYSSVMGESADQEKTWLSSNPKDDYNKSLTNKLINKAHNAPYCAEVEYILCGSNGSSNTDNVKAVYNKIYTIRAGLNLVSGFQHFWALDPATAMQKGLTAEALYNASWAVNIITAGIVPIAVTEAVLIPILTIFETSKDLDRLEAGFPVELYKADADQWQLSIDPAGTDEGIGAFMEALTEGDLFRKPNTGNGLFYSDYLMLFVYLGFNSSAQQGMYQRMAEVIQFNIGTMAGDTSYSLAKSRMYFQLNAELRVKPLMITLPFFSLDEYSNEMTTKTDWCTYKIKTVRGYN